MSGTAALAAAPDGPSPAQELWAQSMFRPVLDGNVFEATVERLAQAIKLGAVPFGQRLAPERELAQALQVSRVTLREAIRALSEAGFLAARRGRGGGTFVVYEAAAAQPGLRRVSAPERLSVMLDYRAVVEPGAAALAATRGASGRLSAADRGYLRACVDECEVAAPDGSHRVADSRLHLAIAGASGCGPLVTAVADVQLWLGDRLAEIPVLGENLRHSHDQHRAVVTAILDGDAVAAAAVMTEHCAATSALLRGLLT